jgi:hypothetical protein
VKEKLSALGIPQSAHKDFLDTTCFSVEQEAKEKHEKVLSCSTILFQLGLKADKTDLVSALILK